MYESSVFCGFILLLGFYAAVASPDGWIRIQLLSVAILSSLQLMGTIFADNCSHPLNAPLTYFSFFLVILQPWMFNEWQWALASFRGNPFSKEHMTLVRVLAWAFAVGMLLRSSPCSSNMCLYCARGEPFCASTGAPACTFKGALHIYWRIPLRPANYLFPGFWAHFTICFLPTFVAGGKYERIQNLIILILGVFAPFSIAYMVDREVSFDELPALWSLALAPLHSVSFVFASSYKIPRKRNKKRDLLGALDPSVIDPDEYNRLREKLEKQIAEEEEEEEKKNKKSAALEEEDGDENRLYGDDDDDDAVEEEDEDENARLSFDDISSTEEGEEDYDDGNDPEESFIKSYDDDGSHVRRRKKL